MNNTRTLPLGLEDLARRPSLAPRGLVAVGRALGIAAATTAAAGAATLAWGSIERRFPTIRRLTVPVRPEALSSPIRILHLSDLHMYPGQDFIVSFLERVARDEIFDFVVSTGDNFGSVDGLDLVLDAHRPFLEYPGAFVLGSNDYYSPEHKGWAEYLKPREVRRHRDRLNPDLPWTEVARTLRDSGWADLSNRADSVSLTPRRAQRGFGARSHEVTLSLIGTDDAHIQRERIVTADTSWDDPHSVRLGITHSPYLRVIDPFTRMGSDLILAGHTHGGQIGIPWFGALVTNCDLPRTHAKGLTRWDSGGRSSWLHVSAGLGTSPFAPIRVATQPEVSLLTLIPRRQGMSV
ncbi:metallophosphoesterase [Schaalia sp. ZJ1691]|uniref:metallophosphoesterase n=1 Tax=Schaalia sp. ZJ1691 TaxID=2709404 RepID=UPI0013EA6DBE|nr:metallophosphoesterase [Schaalia sp. ZJ1691]